MHRDLEVALEYWRSLPKDHGLAGRADIDATKIPLSILPEICLMSFDETGKRIRFRLAGTNFRDFSDHEVAGTFVDELTTRIDNSKQTYQAYIMDLYRQVQVRRLPVYSCGRYVFEDDRQYVDTERLSFPLMEPDGRIISFMGIQTFSPSSSHGLPTHSVDAAKNYLPGETVVISG